MNPDNAVITIVAWVAAGALLLLVLFLHEQGYNYFNINRLTFDEINCLVEGWNEQNEEKERKMKVEQMRKKHG